MQRYLVTIAMESLTAFSSRLRHCMESTKNCIKVIIADINSRTQTRRSQKSIDVFYLLGDIFDECFVFLRTAIIGMN